VLKVVFIFFFLQSHPIYFNFYANWLRGLGAVRGWKSPFPIDLAHGLYKSLYCCTGCDSVSHLPCTK